MLYGVLGCCVISAPKYCSLSTAVSHLIKLLLVVCPRQYPEGMKVLVKGFVDNMPQLMCASDIIVTKAGPGTIGEALICGLPMVLNAFVPCQEEGNIPYVVDNQVRGEGPWALL